MGPSALQEVEVPCSPEASPSRPCGGGEGGAARSLTVLLPSGARVHVRAWDSAADDRLPVCVLLHGFGDSSRVWDAFAQTLARTRTVLAIDLKGHGDSSWDPDGDYRLESYVSDLFEVLERVADRRLALVGHSLGGMLCMSLAADPRLDVAGLLLVDASTSHAPVAIRHMLRMFGDGHRGYASVSEYASALVASRPMSEPAAVRGYAPHLLVQRDALWWPRADARLAEGSDLGSVAVEERLVQALSRCGCPALLVRGACSGFVSAESAQRVSELLPVCDYVEIAGAGHAVMLDQPAAFEQQALDFLHRLPSRSDDRRDTGSVGVSCCA